MTEDPLVDPDPYRFNRIGPFIVERVGINPFTCGYKVWLPNTPEEVHTFTNAREIGNFFDAVCASLESK